MSRWKKHDGSDAMPSALAPTAVLEIEAATWGGSIFIAGLVTGWDEVIRYRPTGETVDPEYLELNR